MSVSPLRLRSLAALAAVVAPLAVVATAGTAASGSSRISSSSEPVGLTLELLSRGTSEEPVEAEAGGIELETEEAFDVAVARITLKPGGTSGWHVHPGPTVVTVTAGELTHVRDDCSEETVTAGQTTVESGPDDLGTVYNHGDTDLVVIVTFFAPPGAELLLPRPAVDCSD